jgi:CheY-like chemotaxis protein
MNGFEALKRLRENPATATIPVMAVTASVMSQDQEKIMAAGFDAFQKKPLDLDGFLEALSRTLKDASGEADQK